MVQITGWPIVDWMTIDYCTSGPKWYKLIIEQLLSAIVAVVSSSIFSNTNTYIESLYNFKIVTHISFWHYDKYISGANKSQHNWIKKNSKRQHKNFCYIHWKNQMVKARTMCSCVEKRKLCVNVLSTIIASTAGALGSHADNLFTRSFLLVLISVYTLQRITHLSRRLHSSLLQGPLRVGWCLSVTLSCDVEPDRVQLVSLALAAVVR